MTISVKPVTLKNLEDEMEPCLEDIPPEKKEQFAGYCQSKKEWFEDATSKYGICAFTAYLDDRPAGLVEFLPVTAVPYPDEKPNGTMFILCFLIWVCLSIWECYSCISGIRLRTCEGNNVLQRINWR